jgi:solute carrier family 35 protein F5
VAACFYATYTIQVRILCPANEELFSMQLLFGYIGLFCFVGLLPFGLYIGIMKTHISSFILMIILTKGLLDFCVTDYCLFRAVILTNPTVATCGLGLTIPMAFAADWALGKADTVTGISALGAVAVTAGFLIVNLSPEKVARDADDGLQPPAYTVSDPVCIARRSFEIV